MNNSSVLLRGTLTLHLLVFAATAQAVDIVNDNFDDGDVTTNTTGVGSGFNTFVALDGDSDTTGIYEAGGEVELRNDIHGFRRTAIVSNESAPIPASGAGEAMFGFYGVSFAENTTGVGTGTTDRMFLGVTSEGVAGSFEQNPPPGFYVQIESDSIVTSGGNAGFNGTSQLFYESSTDSRTQLASWSFDTLDFQYTPADGDGLDFSPTLDFELTLTAAGYDLSIAGDSVSNLTGSLSGTFAGAGITNELSSGHATVFSQNELYDGASMTATVNIMIDQIVISTEVPEPSALFVLCPAALLAGRRRRAAGA